MRNTQRRRWILLAGLAFLGCSGIFIHHLNQRSRNPASDLSFGQAGRPSLVVSSDPGPNLPPMGRSLFDFLTMVDTGAAAKIQVIPFPINKLENSIRNQLQITITEGLHGVMLPLGRSLQRMASAPDFFRYPRVVMGIDANPKIQGVETGMLLRDRLYIGYNEKAAVLEVISYNELSGRYEFEVVHNYASGMTPTITYANRSVCLACHQNQAPIFSDAQWSESNANPEIAQRLFTAINHMPGFDGKTYAGFAIDLGTKTDSAGEPIRNTAEPEAIDHTKFRGNLIPVVQFLWQKLCDEVNPSPGGSADCRAQTLSLAIRMGLSGSSSANHPVLSDSLSAPLIQNLSTAWNRRWPAGIVISSPILPDRDPLDASPKGNPFDPSTLAPSVRAALGNILQTTNVISAEQEPLSPRAPLEIWSATPDANSNFGALGKWIASLGSMFAEVDWDHIDQWLVQNSTNQDQIVVKTTCSASSSGKNLLQLSDCQGPLHLQGSIGWDGDSGIVSGTFGYMALDSGLMQNQSATCDLPDSSANQYSGNCSGSLSFAVGGQITAGDNQSFSFALITSPRQGSRSVRLSDGTRIAKLSFNYGGAGTAQAQVTTTVTLVHDFAYLDKALRFGVADSASGKSTIFALRPFSRTQVLQLLRAQLAKINSDAKDCCLDTSRMPQAQAEPDNSVDANDAQIQAVFGNSAPFVVNCAVCHRNSLGFPPNYLYGSPDQVKSQLNQCAERIWYRLNAWSVDSAHRQKSPMPPMNRLQSLNLSEDQWKNSSALSQLKAAANILLKAKGTQMPDINSVNYDSFPDCKGQ